LEKEKKAKRKQLIENAKKKKRDAEARIEAEKAAQNEKEETGER